jgi:hypothetical protein
MRAVALIRQQLHTSARSDLGYVQREHEAEAIQCLIVAIGL